MNFIEAIKTIKRNENLTVKRKEKVVTYYESLNKLYIEDKSDLYLLELFTPTVDDILAEDWYVVKDEKLHTFEEALKAYKSGKTICRDSFDSIEYAISYIVKYPFRSEDVLANDWIIIDKED